MIPAAGSQKQMFAQEKKEISLKLLKLGELWDSCNVWQAKINSVWIILSRKMEKQMNSESTKKTAQEGGEMDIKVLLDKCSPIKTYRA